MPNSPNILFFPSSVGSSHFHRLRLLSDALREHFGAAGFALKGAASLDLGVDLGVEVPDIVVEDFSENIFEKYSVELIEQCVAAEVALFQEHRPSAVIGDMRFSLAISSRLTRTPYISLVNGYMTEFFNPASAIMSREKRPFQFRMASWLGRRIQNRQKRKLAANFRWVARKHGIKRLNSLYDFLRGDLTLVADIPQFCSMEKLPPDVKYIGPLIWEGTDERIPQFVKNINPAEKLIYVTLGNTGKAALAKWAYDAFAEAEGYKIVITTGGFVGLGELRFPEHFFVTKFIPGSEVLKRASFCIHCGGNGTTYQALAQGVPAVVVPFNTDQLINAHLVKKHGVGIPLSASGLAGQKLMEAVKELDENPRYRENARRFQEILKKWNGQWRAAEEITNYLKLEASVKIS